MVSHPELEVRNRVRNYLNTEKGFRIPLTREVGSRALIYEKPNKSKQFMQMGLCEMYHSIGVHVDWGHEDNEGGTMEEYIRNINDESNNEDNNDIIKSLDSFDFL